MYKMLFLLSWNCRPSVFYLRKNGEGSSMRDVILLLIIFEIFRYNGVPATTIMWNLICNL